MKQAMVVVSFGTSVPEAMKAIENIERTAEQVCGQPVYRAFTSRIIRKNCANAMASIFPTRARCSNT